MTHTVDYTQDETGRWRAKLRGEAYETPARHTIEDAVFDAYELVPTRDVLEVGDVREYHGIGLFS